MHYSNFDSKADRPIVLWWSHSGRDYSRDRIIRNAFVKLGWNIKDFCPSFSATGNLEARLRRVGRPDLVWVPCFRQRDAAAAQRFASQNQVPLIFDPLISSWDKQVFERRKFDQDSPQSMRLLKKEATLFRHSNLVIADTDAHAEFFHTAHGIPKAQIAVIPVGAEEGQFALQPVRKISPRRKILFYGSFIGLQSPQRIAKATLDVRDADWTFIGTGPLLQKCQQIAGSQNHVTFLPRVPYEQLSARIGDADILMGVFGDSPKAGRVIPNKVYQALACGRPVVTRHSNAYPSATRHAPASETGITWTQAGSSSSIAEAINQLVAEDSEQLQQQASSARQTYLTWFSNDIIKANLMTAIQSVAGRNSCIAKAA